MSEVELNQQVADQIRGTSAFEGRQYRAGQWLALLDGNVVAVADDLSTALGALRALDADPRRGMVFEVAPPIVDVIR
jgi:hypothetical protein